MLRAGRTSQPNSVHVYLLCVLRACVHQEIDQARSESITYVTECKEMLQQSLRDEPHYVYSHWAVYKSYLKGRKARHRDTVTMVRRRFQNCNVVHNVFGADARSVLSVACVLICCRFKCVVASWIDPRSKRRRIRNWMI
jgi:hypothetical protein